MVRCNTRTNEARAPQDARHENLTVAREVFENRSLLLDKGGVKVTPIGGDLAGEQGGIRGDPIPFRCSYSGHKDQVPAAWSVLITDQSLLCVVNPHWLAYPPPSHLHHVIMATLYLVIMILGLVGNGLVIFLFISSRALRSPSNLFILNLAVSDFLLVSMMSAVVHNSLLEAPAMGRVGCDLYGFIGGLSGTTSIMTLAAISFDRYLVISYPLDPFKKLSHRQVLAIILATWLYSFTFSVMPLVGFSDINYSPEGYLTTCSFDYLSESTNTRIFIFAFFVAAWVLPLNIIVFSYLSIVSTVSKQERYCRTCQGSFSSSFKHQRLKRKEGVELKLTKVASGIIALWVLAWTPYSVVALLGIFRQRAVITPLVSMLPALFCKTAACLDPFIYALSHPRFKAELANRLVRRRQLLGGMLNGITQGFSVSTFSEIREERELSDVQACGNYDPSTSSLGPLLQRNASSSSNPTLERSRRRDTAGSPGSKSLVSPVSTEIYPRKSLSTYSFRSISKNTKLDEKIEALHKSRRDKCHLELRTTALIELPAAPLPRPPFSLSCSFSTGLERVSLCAQRSALWSTSQMPPAPEDQNCSAEEPPSVESPRKKAKTCTRSHGGLPTATATCRSKGRSNSLPNMTQSSCDRKLDGKFSRNVLLQLFQGRILPGARRNKSSSSIFHDDGKV
ncbi:melanopsin-like [Portunus trituberculatus]|uniref:melanopsin-like n=1 Tax=Portunus trituberculatus TaxID=210409 RepID=UPI001E1CC6E7|nr:melanopsin-like [Portunus trituberculatus]